MKHVSNPIRESQNLYELEKERQEWSFKPYKGKSKWVHVSYWPWFGRVSNPIRESQNGKVVVDSTGVERFKPYKGKSKSTTKGLHMYMPSFQTL